MYDRPNDVSNFDDVGEFHERFGLDNTTYHQIGPREVPPDVLEFRINFMLEELQEFVEAVGGYLQTHHELNGPPKIKAVIPGDNKVYHADSFDALLDLVYVAMGTAHLMGYPWKLGWRLVQRANLLKQRTPSAKESKRGHRLDVVKPAGWTPPNIGRLLTRFGWEVYPK